MSAVNLPNSRLFAASCIVAGNAIRGKVKPAFRLTVGRSKRQDYRGNGEREDIVEGGTGGEVAGPEDEPGLEQRLKALEREVADLRHELCTRRLVVGGSDEDPRLVAEAVNGVMELRLELAGPPGNRSHCLLFATTADAELGAGLGLQLWADGDVVGELSAWRDTAGTWRCRHA